MSAFSFPPLTLPPLRLRLPSPVSLRPVSLAPRLRLRLPLSARPLLSSAAPPPPPCPPADPRPDRPDGRDPSPSSPLALYLSLLSRRPLPTKIVTSAVLTALSDLIAQLYSGTPLSARRLLSLFLVGAVLTAPMFHLLYHYLELYIPASSGPLAILAQLAVDQLIAAPVWLAAFFAILALFDHPFDRNALEKQMRRDFIPALKLTWTVFPPVQLLSFALLPPVTRVLTLNVVDLAYTTILSYIKHRPYLSDAPPQPS